MPASYPTSIDQHLVRRFTRVALLGTMVVASACSQESDMTPASAAAATVKSPNPSIAEISDAQWARLAQRTIFFGHQSVGGNIVQGIEELMQAEPRIKLRVVRSPRPATVTGPAFVHFEIGKNYDPASKDTAFAAALDGLNSSGTIALYKYCFVDMAASTNPDSLFAEYELTTEAARASHPGLTIVHVTMPLLSAQPTSKLKLLVKRLLGRGESPEVALNAKRNRFNRLLRQRYGNSDAFFDLASIESTRLDGSRSSFTLNGETVYTLAPEYTTDGGHLNAQGRRKAAEALLARLATLPDGAGN